MIKDTDVEATAADNYLKDGLAEHSNSWPVDKTISTLSNYNSGPVKVNNTVTK